MNAHRIQIVCLDVLDWAFRVMVAVIVAVALLSLAGCTPSTAGGVRDLGPDRQASFIAPENYQVVYRKVLEQERKCHQSGILAAWVAQGDLYTDTKSGTITVAMYGAVGAQMHQVIDVTAIDNQQTRITGYFTFGAEARWEIPVLKAWVLDNSKKCASQ